MYLNSKYQIWLHSDDYKCSIEYKNKKKITYPQTRLNSYKNTSLTCLCVYFHKALFQYCLILALLDINCIAAMCCYDN